MAKVEEGMTFFIGSNMFTVNTDSLGDLDNLLELFNILVKKDPEKKLTGLYGFYVNDLLKKSNNGNKSFLIANKAIEEMNAIYKLRRTNDLGLLCGSITEVYEKTSAELDGYT